MSLVLDGFALARHLDGLDKIIHRRSRCASAGFTDLTGGWTVGVGLEHHLAIVIFLKHEGWHPKSSKLVCFVDERVGVLLHGVANEDQGVSRLVWMRTFSI
jgi:hypothetical protein